ncbi:MAG: hypothetical protein RXS23_09830 [Metallosphaera yellowstonensis]
MEVGAGVFQSEEGLTSALKSIRGLKTSLSDLYVRDRAFEYNLEWIHT